MMSDLAKGRPLAIDPTAQDTSPTDRSGCKNSLADRSQSV